MASPFLGQISIVGFNFAARGWAFCNGQLLPIAQNTALFSLLGTTYGGNGTTNFALPNMQGRAPMHPGQGGGLSLRDLGEQSGSESVTLLTSELPSHTHTASATQQACSTGPGISNDPAGRFPGITQRPLYTEISTGTLATAPTTAVAGSSQAHENRQPYLAMNFIIAQQGVFPARN
jgi:microcystin-dependent protein